MKKETNIIDFGGIKPVSPNIRINLDPFAHLSIPSRPVAPETVTVERAAKFLKCTTRRVRTLLSSGRLLGHKDEIARTRPWKVVWPLQLKSGTRGPDMRRLPTRLPKE